MLIIVSTTIMAVPKDNFKKSSLFLGGNIQGYTNASNIFNEDIENKATISLLGLTSYIGVFIVDNLSLQPNISLSTYDFSFASYDSEGELSKDNGSGSNTIGAGISLVYYFTILDPFIPYFGLGGNFSSIYYSDAIINDEVFMSGYNELYATATVETGALYFLNDNIAIDFGVDINFSNSRILTDADGNEYEYEDDYNHTEWIDMITNYTLGISYFLPSNPKLMVAGL